jgi:hypothetical protein
MEKNEKRYLSRFGTVFIFSLFFYDHCTSFRENYLFSASSNK